MKERLNKYIARCGICSRRKADELIEMGSIYVNKKRIMELGTLIDPDNDLVTIKQKPIKPESQFVYYLMNKPAGFITTIKDPEKRPTVIELLSGIKTRVYPVGRLDMDTQGLLILTNDGDLANRLAHPRYGIKKTYEVCLKGFLTETVIKKLEKGIYLEDGLTSPCSILLLNRYKNESICEITISEGKKRQVRRMFEISGYPVIRLTRTLYGPLKLGRLRLGEYRELTGDEIDKLYRAVILTKKTKN